METVRRLVFARCNRQSVRGAHNKPKADSVDWLEVDSVPVEKRVDNVLKIGMMTMMVIGLKLLKRSFGTPSNLIAPDKDVSTEPKPLSARLNTM